MPYGLREWGDLFTSRQLVAIATFSDLVLEARDQVKLDAIGSGYTDNGVLLHDDGKGASAYADAIAVYLGFLVSKLADKGSTLCTWDAGPVSNRTASGRSASRPAPDRRGTAIR